MADIYKVNYSIIILTIFTCCCYTLCHSWFTVCCLCATVSVTKYFLCILTVIALQLQLQHNMFINSGIETEGSGSSITHSRRSHLTENAKHHKYLSHAVLRNFKHSPGLLAGEQ